MRGRLPQGRGWLDSGSATQESSPGEEGLLRKRGQAGALGWPVGPGTRLGLLGNPGAALSAFQQAPLLFPLLCSIHGPAPGPGGRAGEPGTLCRRPSAQERLLLPRPCLLSQDPWDGAAELCWSGRLAGRLLWPFRVGGQGDSQGRIPDCFLLG